MFEALLWWWVDMKHGQFYKLNVNLYENNKILLSLLQLVPHYAFYFASFQGQEIY